MPVTIIAALEGASQLDEEQVLRASKGHPAPARRRQGRHEEEQEPGLRPQVGAETLSQDRADEERRLRHR